MSWFLEQFTSADNSEEYKEREEERIHLLERINQLNKELDASRSSASEMETELREKHQAELEGWEKTLSGLQSSTDQMNDEAEYWRQEIALLQEKVTQAETQNRDIVQSMQTEEWEGSADEGSVDALRQQLLTGKNCEASLKGVITAKKLLIEDAKREQMDLRNLVRLKEQQLEVLATEARQLQVLRDTELQQLESRVEEVQSSPTAPSEDLSAQVQANHRMIEGLITEKAALVLQLEAQRNAPQDANPHRGPSRMASMRLFRGHRTLRKVVSVLDDFVLEVQTLADEQAALRLGLLLYMVVLHLWVLLSALDVRGCPTFMS